MLLNECNKQLIDAKMQLIDINKLLNGHDKRLIDINKLLNGCDKQVVWMGGKKNYPTGIIFDENSGYMLITVSGTLEQIVEEVEKMSETERQFLLIKLRAQKKRKNYTPIALFGKGVKQPSMKEIDKIKHASRSK